MSWCFSALQFFLRSLIRELTQFYCASFTFFSGTSELLDWILWITYWVTHFFVFFPAYTFFDWLFAFSPGVYISIFCESYFLIFFKTRQMCLGVQGTLLAITTLARSRKSSENSYSFRFSSGYILNRDKPWEFLNLVFENEVRGNIGAGWTMDQDGAA